MILLSPKNRINGFLLCSTYFYTRRFMIAVYRYGRSWSIRTPLLL